MKVLLKKSVSGTDKGKNFRFGSGSVVDTKIHNIDVSSWVKSGIAEVIEPEPKLVVKPKGTKAKK